ncbi:hypothetical protein Tco_0919795 [Tanacetum coccineum]
MYVSMLFKDSIDDGIIPTLLTSAVGSTLPSNSVLGCRCGLGFAIVSVELRFGDLIKIFKHVASLVNVGLINANVTSQTFEPPSFTKSPDEVPLTSLDTVPQKDLMNGHVHMYNDPTYNGVEIPVVKGRAFHIPQLADPMDLWFWLLWKHCTFYFGATPPVMPAQLESVVLQEKSVEQYEQAVSYNRTDSLLGSIGSVLSL